MITRQVNALWLSAAFYSSSTSPKRSKRRVVTRVTPNFMVKALGLFDPAIRGIIPDLGCHSPTDNSRARALLGEEFLDVRESVVSTANYLIDNDLI